MHQVPTKLQHTEGTWILEQKAGCIACHMEFDIVAEAQPNNIGGGSHIADKGTCTAAAAVAVATEMLL